jgi:hypothetical protein
MWCLEFPFTCSWNIIQNKCIGFAYASVTIYIQHRPAYSYTWWTRPKIRTGFALWISSFLEIPWEILLWLWPYLRTKRFSTTIIISTLKAGPEKKKKKISWLKKKMHYHPVSSIKQMYAKIIKENCKRGEWGEKKKTFRQKKENISMVT